jgi:hypothetical protein
MNKPRLIFIFVSVIILGLILIKHSHSEGLNFAELESSDEKAAFDDKLLARQKALDSLTKIYQNKAVTIYTFNKNFSGDLKKILVYSHADSKILDTLTAGDTVQLIDTAPFKGNPNALVRTRKGVTGYIYYFRIKQFEDVLSKKGLEIQSQ